MKALGDGAGNQPRFLHRAEDLRAGEGSHGEKQIQGQKYKKIQTHRKDGSGEKLEKCNDGEVCVVTIVARSEDLEHREKEDQVNCGLQKALGNESVVNRKKTDVT